MLCDTLKKKNRLWKTDESLWAINFTTSTIQENTLGERRVDVITLWTLRGKKSVALLGQLLKTFITPGRIVWGGSLQLFASIFTRRGEERGRNGKACKGGFGKIRVKKITEDHLICAILPRLEKNEASTFLCRVKLLLWCGIKKSRRFVIRFCFRLHY